jgi:transposase-like protein
MGQLPPANTRRWVVRRKAAVVAAVQSGKITLEEACQRYQLTEEEFRSWQRAYEAHGRLARHPPSAIPQPALAATRQTAPPLIAFLTGCSPELRSGNRDRTLAEALALVERPIGYRDGRVDRDIRMGSIAGPAAILAAPCSLFSRPSPA